MEETKEGENNKLILKIKERKITNSGFSPTINYLLINFGNDNAKMAEYKAILQVGKKYYFNGGNLENAKILTNKRLDLNNSADKIPEIRVFNEEGETITHKPKVPKDNPKPPVNNNLKPTNTELVQLKIIFQKLNIKKITFENGKLTIMHNNKIIKNSQLTDKLEYQTLKEYCQKNHEREITKKQLGIKSDTNNSTNPKPNNHQLQIGLAIGAGVVMMVGAIVYFVQKRNKNN
jgi:hypothetical protein